MTYAEFTQQLIVRLPAALNGIKDALVSAGVQASRVTVSEVEDANDLRYRLEAVRGGKTLTVYFELTASVPIGGSMGIALTVYADVNGVPSATSFVGGSPVVYDDSAGLAHLINKLVEIEGMSVSELRTWARAALGV